LQYPELQHPDAVVCCINIVLEKIFASKRNKLSIFFRILSSFSVAAASSASAATNNTVA
jgi:hypothetical protein